MQELWKVNPGLNCVLFQRFDMVKRVMSDWCSSVMKLKGGSVGSMTPFWVCGYLMRIGANDGIQLPAILFSSLVSLVVRVTQAGLHFLQESKLVMHLTIYRENERVLVEPNWFVFDFGGCASNGGMPYYIANGPYEDFDSHFSDYGGFQSFVHGVPASFNSHDVNSRLHFQKGTIPALLNTLGLARKATGQRVKQSCLQAAGGETPSPSPPPQRQRVSPYNKDGMKGLTNSVNARSCSPERTQSPPDAAGIGKEKPKASDDDDGGGKDKVSLILHEYRHRTFSLAFSVERTKHARIGLKSTCHLSQLMHQIYSSAKVTRSIWKPAFMNGTDWPRPAANSSIVEQHNELRPRATQSFRRKTIHVVRISVGD
uniref:Uncharacterized protein n=1 Tax=Vitis vinifera TaxID=29760 RepID=A5AIH0_VITVI|nr:hypothetical protein VITISV_039516 [Vitis vinifera]